MCVTPRHTDYSETGLPRRVSHFSVLSHYKAFYQLWNYVGPKEGVVGGWINKT